MRRHAHAKNLRGRHPLAATGFLFAIRSTAFKIERATALKLIDLLVKLAQETDGYDATGLIVVDWKDPESGAVVEEEIAETTQKKITVTIDRDLIPAELDPAAFLHTMVDAVLEDARRQAR